MTDDEFNAAIDRLFLSVGEAIERESKAAIASALREFQRNSAVFSDHQAEVKP